MRRTGRKKEWTLALFCVGILVLFPPIVSIFDKPVLVMGLPIAYVVLFGFWGLVIAAVAYGARRKASTDDPGASSDSLIDKQSDS
ncbi:MAG: hypothetical protein H8D75_02345 [Rhodospirillaceae bacterium]|nr:hypothetical protein [Rhodospirillaceae bacterium]MBL6931484.1 hypothetical protein [Rhodospirillales bacterium]